MNLVVLENIKTCHGCIRGSGKNTCPEDGGQIHIHAERADCPRGLHTALDGTPPAATADQPSSAVPWHDATRALWKELHEQALRDGLTHAWLDGFASRVPCGDCRNHLREMMRGDLPPVFGPGAFEWTWKVHQRINQRLGKPGLTLDEARRLYGDVARPPAF